MFQITKLSQASQSFISALSTTGKSRSLETSIALGRVLAMDLPLPTAPVDNVVMFFKLQFQIEMERYVSTLNEIVVLNTSAVFDYALKFYEYRYSLVNPDKYILATNKETGLVDFFKISKVFDSATIAAIQNNPTLLTEQVNSFKKIKDELSV